ncbi:MAG: N-acetyltransferase [Chitinophagia bacterium]|jgi:RimJ/RimL family protein N-acetyltransferase|nr:N-acetyltransferase [Chitinophagia bacterium]NCA29330.1 N-acetyltransferase [Chitinophagia bacterium]NDD15936.1 N-acetyltransferase [Chitinophagia bacterium]
MLAFKNFDFASDIILENERVLLRPLLLTDGSFLAHYINEEPELWKYSLVAINNTNDLENYIQTALDARLNKTAYAFIVFDKLLNEFVGCTRFYDIQLNFQTTQIGYTWYSKKCWGTKLNENCKYLLLQFAFDQMGFERVEFRADNNNKRSIAAMQKIGCTVEGVLKNHLPMPNGKRRDSIILSILKEDWNASLKQALAAQLNEQLKK